MSSLRVLLLALVVVAGACAKSHDVALDGGESGDGGAGSGGTGGTGGDAGTGGGGAPMCVVSECDPAPTLPIPIPIDSCCTADDQCGLSTALLGGGACTARDAPGPLDPSCPSQSMMGFTLPGCCTAAGTCGIKDTFIGFGCVAFGGGSQACGDGPGGNGGSGGAGGNGGAGGTGGNGCNNCPALGFAAPFIGVTACCTTAGQCGGNLQGMCIELGQPGEPSSECPAVSVMGQMLDGCCRPDGMCGADDGGAIGFGCTLAPGATGTCTPSGVIPE